MVLSRPVVLSRPGSKVPSFRYICYGYSHAGAARAFTNVQNAARVNAFNERSERCAIAVHDNSAWRARKDWIGRGNTDCAWNWDLGTQIAHEQTRNRDSGAVTQIRETSGIQDRI